MSSSEIISKSPIVIVQETLRHNVEKQTEGAVTVLYDEAEIPSFMLRVPRFNVETIDSAMGRGVHPAFVVNGKEVDEIFIGQVPATLLDGRGYSLPGRSAKTSITFDEAREACAKKGKGWHLTNSWEYAALVAYVVKNRDKYFQKSWWEWVDGMKLVDGKFYFPKTNDFETPENEWEFQGAGFDDIEGRPVLSADVTHYSEKNPKGDEDDRDENYTRIGECRDLEVSESYKTLSADLRERFTRMLIDPSAASIITDNSDLYVRNYGTRLPVRGGYWDDGASAGLAALDLLNRRVISGSDVGFRPAFIGI
jgi:hypothetical protein